MAGSLEIRLFNFIRRLHQEIVDMKPEDGFSSPRDLELVTEVNKKSAVFDKLQEAMRIYNPNFKYEPKDEGQEDFSIGVHLDKFWMKEKVGYGINCKQDYINVWDKIKYVKIIEELLVSHEFNFNINVDINKVMPDLLSYIKDQKLSFINLYSFKLTKINNSLYLPSTITYDEVRNLFLHCSYLDIEPLKDLLKDYSLLVNTKKSLMDKKRFIFKIGV